MATDSSFITDTHQGDLVTSGERELIETVIYACLCATVCVFGIAGNIINIIIFLKQGFKCTSNVSFCGLAISDMCCLITQMWFNVCMNPLMKSPGVPIETSEMHYLLGGVPSLCFSRITGWITVYVTAERCLGIAIPLKVKQFVTVRRTALIVIFIYCFNIACYYPEYRNYYIGWKFYPEKNRSLVGLISRGDNADITVMYISSSSTGLVSFLAVVVLTAILVSKLSQKSAWRRSATSRDKETDSSLCHRDRKTMKMIVLIASVMIACYTPGTLAAMVTKVEPEFSLFGNYQNIFMVFWSFAFLAQDVNSSVNIFLYYHMSTKYRRSFEELLVSQCKQS